MWAVLLPGDIPSVLWCLLGAVWDSLWVGLAVRCLLAYWLVHYLQQRSRDSVMRESMQQQPKPVQRGEAQHYQEEQQHQQQQQHYQQQQRQEQGHCDQPEHQRSTFKPSQNIEVDSANNTVRRTSIETSSVPSNAHRMPSPSVPTYHHPYPGHVLSSTSSQYASQSLSSTRAYWTSNIYPTQQQISAWQFYYPSWSMLTTPQVKYA